MIPAMKHPHRFLLSTLIAIFALGMLVDDSRSAEETLTPLVAAPLVENTRVFPGTDGRLHFVYELVLTNTRPTPATLTKIEVLDPADPSMPLARFEGAELTSRLRTTANSAPENAAIEFNGTRLFLVNFSLPLSAKVPMRLVHRIELLAAGLPPQPSGTPVAQAYTVATTKVAQELVKISPPLAGKGWVAVNGCCGPGGVHRSTGLPVNGKIYFAQRFAIDWMKLDEDGRLVDGDPSDVRNYTDYGEEILAVADGTVVETLNTLPEQKPGHLPDPKTITLANIDGNHVVLDIGAGLYAFYAHMQTGSVRVKAGDRVRRGQVLGKLGNTGNTSAPHLHFHIMEGPSVLGSNGVPYLLDSFTIEGQVSPAQFAATESLTGIWNQGMSSASLKRSDQFPLDLLIVEFASPNKP